MIYVIEKILNDDVLSKCIEYTSSSELKWYDGNQTASGIAKEGKYSLQAGNFGSPYEINQGFEKFSDEIRSIIRQNESFDKFACDTPTLLSPLFRVNKYNEGMKYDWHSDYNWMGIYDIGEPRLSNYAYSLALTDDYEGGELQIKLPNSYTNGERDIKTFKGKPGDMIIFPTNYLHRVTEVTRGSRIVINGWLTHSVKHPDDLSELLNIEELIRSIRSEDPDDIEKLTELFNMKYNYLTKIDIIK